MSHSHIDILEPSESEKRKDVQAKVQNVFDPNSDEIDLTNSRLDNMDDFSVCPNLERLILRQNRIPCINDSLKKLDKLTELDLYENKLQEIPPNTLPLNLTYLDLSFNEIRHPSNLDGLTKLKELYLVQNKIRAIQGVSALTSLTLLELGDNRIRAIENISSLTNLRELWLGRNKIEKIEGLEKLVKLRKLSIQSNRLTSIGDGLSTLTHLRELYLSHNGLQHLSGLDKLANLLVLDLAGNFLTSLGQGLKNLTKLKELWLNDNQISSFDDLKQIGSQQLRTIYLERNPVQTSCSADQYRQQILAILPNLVQIDAIPIRDDDENEFTNEYEDDDEKQP